ncbi:unnamed protein product [Polarella glacialis]|uniref:peptidylprolyl isomerase n=1 Tax=Polarella glacialis TaxID=89957 RepID=A0A813FA70_POLGL|nr:unnamed protein product [Polarella glacialis]
MVQTWRRIISASKPAAFGDSGGAEVLELRCCCLLPLAEGGAFASGRGPTLYCSADGGLTRLALARPTEDEPHCKVRAGLFARGGSTLSLSVAGGGKVLVVGVVTRLPADESDVDAPAVVAPAVVAPAVVAVSSVTESRDGPRPAKKKARPILDTESSPKPTKSSRGPEHALNNNNNNANRSEGIAPSLSAASRPQVAWQDLGFAGPQAVKLKKEDVEKETHVLPCGVRFEVLRPGRGQVASYGNCVHVRYEGRLANSGRRFDKGDIKFRLGLGKMIRGWDEGIPGMVKGEKRTLFIPSHLGYGSKGAPPQIPRNADLVFQVELLNENVY